MAKSKKETYNFYIATWRDGQSAVGEDFKNRISLTVPNLVSSTQEIIDKSMSGMISFPESDLVFLDDSEIPDFSYMSHIERVHYAALMRHTIEVRRDALVKTEKDISEVDVASLSEPIEPPVSIDPPEEVPDLPEG